MAWHLDTLGKWDRHLQAFVPLRPTQHVREHSQAVSRSILTAIAVEHSALKCDLCWIDAELEQTGHVSRHATHLVFE